MQVNGWTSSNVVPSGSKNSAEHDSVPDLNDAGYLVGPIVSLIWYVAAAAERIRAQQVEVLTAVLASHGVTAVDCPPIVAAVLIAGISVLLALEQGSLGMSTGHAETITYVEEYLRRLEGERQS